MENDSGLKKIFVAALLGMLSLGPVFAMPDRSWGQSSGPGVWNFLDFGNWDVSSLDAGTVFRNL